MVVLVGMFGCWSPVKTGPTPFEEMVYAGRLVDSRPLGLQVRGAWPEGWTAQEPRTEGPWVEARRLDTPDGPRVAAIDVVLPRKADVDLIRTYWLEPDAVEEVPAVPPLAAWQTGAARVSVWHQPRSSVATLWEPVEPGAFTPRLLLRPRHRLIDYVPTFESCTLLGHGMGAASTPFVFGTHLFDLAPSLEIGADRVRWVSGGPRQDERIAAVLDKALGPRAAEGWRCGDDAVYRLATLPDGRVEVVLTKDRT
jgi:hypothetical protein